MNQNAKIGLAVGLLLVAGGIWFFTSGSSGPPAAAADGVQYMCDTCGWLVSLTPAQQTQWGKEGKSGLEPDVAKEAQKNTAMGVKGGGVPAAYRCEKCGTFTVVRASKCPEDGNWYTPVRHDGGDGDCPAKPGKPAKKPG